MPLNISSNDYDFLEEHGVSGAELSTGAPVSYADNYSIFLKVLFVSIGCVSLTTSIIAIVAMQRTKRIPFTPKFLSTSLLTFDLLYITSTSIRKFIVDPATNLNIQVLGSAVLILAMVTIGLMAVERFVVFKWPIVYMRNSTSRCVRSIAATVWLVSLTVFLLCRYLACPLVFRSTNVFIQAGACNNIMYPFYAILICGILIVSLTGYCTIFFIVKNKSRPGPSNLSLFSTAKVIRHYKSTSMVSLYVAVVFVSSMSYLTILLLRMTRRIEQPTMILCIEFSSIFNCIMDPFLYVLWFRESKMEVLKMFCSSNKSVMQNVERMRIDIFSIVTVDKYQPITR